MLNLCIGMLDDALGASKKVLYRLFKTALDEIQSLGLELAKDLSSDELTKLQALHLCGGPQPAAHTGSASLLEARGLSR